MFCKYFACLVCTVFICFSAWAIAVPSAKTFHPVFNDTTLSHSSVLLPKQSPQKKAGFFARLKNKVAAFVLHQAQPKEASSSTKNILSWASLAMVAIGIGLGFAGAALLY